MKKIYNLMIIAGTILFLLPAGCSLDKYPQDAIVTEQAFQTMADAAKQRNALYSLLRARQYGLFTQTAEVMGDMFNATLDFGNRQGPMHILTADMPDDYNVRDIWFNCYSAIAQVNNFISKIGNVVPEAAGDDVILANYAAEGHYVRAHLYYILIKYFGVDYEPGTAASKPGVPIVTEFNVNERPARATVKEVYDFILAEITEAEKLTVAGVAKSERITIDAVKALKSKIQLLMHDFTGAAATAGALISSGKYPLVTTVADLKASWVNDNSTEDIFLMYASNTEAGAVPAGSGSASTEQNQSIYATYSTASLRYVPDFLPTQTTVDLYVAGDLRRDVFLSDPATDIVRSASVGGDFPGVFFLKKYPGNPALFSSANTNYRHKPKVARIAEQYLIAAEALNSSGGLTYLNALRTARGLSTLGAWSDAELQNEWAREMIGEGVRIECLKRWNLGFNGRLPQDAGCVIGPTDANYAQKSCPAGYYRFTLPVPVNELRTNPNMAQTPEWLN